MVYTPFYILLINELKLLIYVVILVVMDGVYTYLRRWLQGAQETARAASIKVTTLFAVRKKLFFK